MDLILSDIKCTELGGAVRIITKSNGAVAFEPMYDDGGTTRIVYVNDNVAGLVKCRNDGIQYMEGILETVPSMGIPSKLAQALMEWDKRDIREVTLYHRPFKEIRQEKGVIITVYYAAVKPGAFDERVRWHRAERLRVA